MKYTHTKLIGRLLICMTCLSISCVYSQDDLFKGENVDLLSLNKDLLNISRKKISEGDSSFIPAYNKLIKKVENEYDSYLYSVMQKEHMPPSGNIHDYMSLARYFWPNPNTENGLPYVQRDGRTNPEIGEYDRDDLYAMSTHVFELAIAYYLTGKSKYASKAAKQIKHWFFNKESYMAPHFKYGQSIPGIRDGGSAGLIESRDFIKIIEAVNLIYNSSYWSKQDQISLQIWFDNFLNWMIHSPAGIGESMQSNNHGTWYDAQIAVYASFTENPGIAKNAVNRTLNKRASNQIALSGSQPAELSRWTAQQYTWFNMDAMLTVLTIKKQLNIIDESNGKEQIKNALNWLLPYAKGEEWDFEQIADFDECRYLELFLKASELYNDPEYKSTALHIFKTTPKCRDDLSVLLYSTNF